MSTAMADARTLNWRFVVPDEPEDLVVVHDAVPDGAHRGVVAPDLAAVSRRHGSAALPRLAAAVEPGGWLYVGFANATSPSRLGAGTSMRLSRALEVLRRAGLNESGVYLAFPDHRCPAYLVSGSGPSELDWFLRNLFFPFAGGATGWKAKARQQALRAMHRAALAAPHAARVALAPAYAVVAVRPA